MLGHLGDGTFGRALRCQPLDNEEEVAVKVVRAVDRYTSSAKIEAKILFDIKSKGGSSKNIVELKDTFIHEEKNTCLVFELSGRSLYDFIKANCY